MYRRRHQFRTTRGKQPSSRKKARPARIFTRRPYLIEKLEERCVLSGTSLVNAVLPDEPPTLAEAFSFHSNSSATIKIYLDFDGQNVHDTPWNDPPPPPETGTGIANFTNKPFSTDANLNAYTDDELSIIQSVWEQVSEDFRPFNVDVTTEDPGDIEALKNTGGGDTEYGIRVVIGGSTNDWYTFATGITVDRLTIPDSFNAVVPANKNDTPAFVFSDDLAANPNPIYKTIAEATSNIVGVAMGLKPDQTLITNPNPPPPLSPQIYAGHGTGPTSWAPIMGDAFAKELTQWSDGTNYSPSNKTADDLNDIRLKNGIEYRTDDYGSTRGTASTLGLDPNAPTGTDADYFLAEGIIETNTDVDYFAFTIDGLGGSVSFDIDAFYNSPNLDILAKIVDESGNLIAQSNPIHGLSAGGSSIVFDINTGDYVEGGWLDENGDPLLDANGDPQTEFNLLPGTYYLSVEGTGKQSEQGDPGYSDYGSLGAYTVTGTKQKGLVIGIDFDATGGAAPTNWNSYFGGPNDPDANLAPLISEAGAIVPYTLKIDSGGADVQTSSSTFVDPADLPIRNLPLDELAGYIDAQGGSVTLTWANLEPWSFHQIWVFGHSDVEARNQITITGGNLNGVDQVFSFTQEISPTSLIINDGIEDNGPLSASPLTVLSDANGEIHIQLDSVGNFPTGLAGLAILPTRPIGPASQGSISGQKWNDDGGGNIDNAANRIKNSGEDGLEGWIIYNDANNNGVLDQETTPEQTVTVINTTPQAIPDADLDGVKSSINIAESGAVLDVDVELNITHTYDADVRAYLVSPSGTEITLFENVGFNGDNFGNSTTNTAFDDAAVIDIDDPVLAFPPYVGHFRPQEALDTFNGEEAHGVWQLVLKDDAALNAGVLNNWKITIKIAGSVIFLEDYTVTDASGNYSFDPLDPGVYHIREYITPDQAALGWQNTWSPTPITVTSGGDIQDVDFGNWIPTSRNGSISGQKWYDADQDGVNDEQERGLPGWIIYLDADGDGVRDQDVTPTVYTNATPMPILDPPVAATMSQVTVDSVRSVLDVSVTIDLDHTFIGDLTAYLVSPSLKQVQLFGGIGGQLNDLNNITFSDSAAKSISEITPADWNQGYSGTWRPLGNLSDFVNDDAAGIWTLVISDTVPHDEGILNSWSLNIRTGEEFRTTDGDGFYEFQNLPAGTYKVREVPGAAPWVQDDPAVTDIPAASWANGTWTVTIEAQDDFNLDPPDAHRNVVDVDFGNYGPLGALQGYVYNDLNGSSSKGLGEPGLAGWTVLLDSELGDTPGELDTDIVDTTLSSDSGVAINHGFPVSSKIWFGDVSSITDVDVSLNVVHDFDSDLTATLISPSGTRVKLLTGLGGSGDNFQITSFDDDATASITTGTAPFDGTFQPMEPLSKFVGENSSGFWTLEIIDNSAANDGFLNQWSITILGDELHTVTDAQGHYSFDHLAPGTYDLAASKVLGWTPTEGPRTVTVESGAILNENLGFQTPVLTGDYTGQGSVSLAGYVTWRKQSGQSGPGLPSDGNHDDNVNQTDYVLWRENFGTYVDDFGNNAAAAEVVLVPSKTYANIEVSGDTDWFTFDAVSGTKYQFQVNRLTLDGAVLRLLDTNGTTLLGTSNESSPFIEWTAPADGTYFAEVRGSSSSSVGVYSLAIAEDATGASAANATLIAVPSTTTGATVPAGETDWYRFTAIAGTQYHVQAQLGTLTNATVKLISTNGVTQLASATGAAPAFDSAPLASAVYYITVTSANSGTYNLSLSALPGPSAGLSDSPTFASMLAADETGSTSGLLLSPFATSTNTSSRKALQTNSSAIQVNDEALLTLLNQGSNAGSGSNSADSGAVASKADESEISADDENLDGIDAMFELIGGTARV